MSMKNMFSILLLASIIALAATAAYAATVNVDQADGFDPAAVTRVAFLPLTRIMPVEEGRQPVCPLTKRSFDGCALEDSAEAELSRAIGQALMASGAPVTWVPQSEINAARARLKKEGGQTLSTAGPAQLAIGRAVKADAVLTGFIYCYRERSGNAWASARPAALAFCLHLIDPATGKILWSLRLHDEQVPLASDLSTFSQFVKRKGQWITVGQMAEEAATLAAGNLPWPRETKEHKGG